MAVQKVRTARHNNAGQQNESPDIKNDLFSFQLK